MSESRYAKQLTRSKYQKAAAGWPFFSSHYFRAAFHQF